MTSHLPWQYLKSLPIVYLVFSLLMSQYGSGQLFFVFDTFYLFPTAKTNK